MTEPGVRSGWYEKAHIMWSFAVTWIMLGKRTEGGWYSLAMHSAVYTTETETQKYDIYKFFWIYIIMTRQKYFDSIYFSSVKSFFNLNSYCRDCLQTLLTWTARARLTNERLCALFSGWLSALWRGLHGCIRLAAFLRRNLSWLTQNTNFVEVLGTVQHGYEWNEKMKKQQNLLFYHGQSEDDGHY